MKRRISIEWDDAPDLLSSGNHLLEVVTVHPFDKILRRGWIVTFRSVKNPIASFQVWLTVEVDNKEIYWQVEKTGEFLAAAGLAEIGKEAITHRNLLGVKIWCWVVRRPNKRGEFINVIKKYHLEKPADVEFETE